MGTAHRKTSSFAKLFDDRVYQIAQSCKNQQCNSRSDDLVYVTLYIGHTLFRYIHSASFTDYRYFHLTWVGHIGLDFL